MNRNSGRARKRTPSHGFTLIELMVAMTIFLIIGGAAMTLFKQHANLFTTQQGEVGLNMNLRNALQQIQMDGVEAGNGFYVGGATQTSSTPAGITIQNAAGAFDTVYFIQATTPAVPLGGAAGCILTTSGSAILAPSTVPASQFGNYVMFMKPDNTQFTVAQLTAASGNSGVTTLTYTPTNADGTSPSDPTLLTATPNPPNAPPGYEGVGDKFCNPGDLAVGLSWVEYYVDGQNRLVRKTSGGSQEYVADNILGFKVGAATYQSGAGNSTSTPAYSFCATCPQPTGYSNIFTLIRSVRVSLIGRTPPGQFTGQSFRNNYDGGQYRIQALSLVINPRNLSMND